MQFLSPIWLWGLTGMLIPIGIHLLSRKAGRTIKIGSVRHLEDTHTKQFKSLRLNEVLLLAVRCLLISTLVFLLSGLQFKEMGKESRWLLIEKGLEHDPEFSSLIDSLQQDKFDIKILAPGFPPLKDSLYNSVPINYWNLMEDLKKESLNQVIVLSYSYAVGFKGLRQRLPNNIQWISKNPNPVDFPLQAIRMSNDSISLRTGRSGGDKTTFRTTYGALNKSQSYFKTATGDSIPVVSQDTISIAVTSDHKFQYDKKIMIAALTVLEESSAHVFDIDTASMNRTANQEFDWIVWLSEKSFTSISSHTIVYQNSEHPNDINLFQRKAGSNQNYSSWVFTKRLNEEVALHDNLTAQLALVLLPKEKQETRAQMFDRRTLPEKLIWDPQASSASEVNATTRMVSAEKIAAILFFVILIFERFLALKRNQ